MIPASAPAPRSRSQDGVGSEARRQARQEQEESDWSSSIASSSFFAGQPSKCQRKSRDMAGFFWEREHEECLLEACKQEGMAVLSKSRSKEKLHVAISGYINEKKGVELRANQIKNKLEGFQKLWRAYHRPNEATSSDFRMVDKYPDQFKLLFSAISPSDMSGQSGCVLRQTPQSSGSCKNLEAALTYLYEHGCKDGCQFANYTHLMQDPDILVGFFVMPTYEQRISYLEALQGKAMENGTKDVDVREGQLKLMEERLAATIPSFVHTALVSGLANIT